MRRRAVAAASTVLLACSACVGTAGAPAGEPAATPTPTPTSERRHYDAASASPQEQWAHFVLLARRTGLPHHTWPSTGKNAMITAAIVCHNPESHGATELSLYHGHKDWKDIRRGDILFARAFCPEAEGPLTRALSGRPDAALAAAAR